MMAHGSNISQMVKVDQFKSSNVASEIKGR